MRYFGLVVHRLERKQCPEELFRTQRGVGRDSLARDHHRRRSLASLGIVMPSDMRKELDNLFLKLGHSLEALVLRAKMYDGFN